jgi:hypothetical protein
MPKRTVDEYLAMDDDELEIEVRALGMTDSCDAIR